MKLPRTKFYCEICEGVFIKRNVKEKEHRAECVAQQVKENKQWEQVKNDLRKDDDESH